MTDQTVEQDINITTEGTENNIPFTLRGFGEIPPGYVSVFRVVKKERVPEVAKAGLTTEDNQLGKIAPDLENLFNEEAVKLGIDTDRTKCIFASPDHPNKLKFSFGYDPKTEVLLEIKVDPTICRVAEGGVYSTANTRYWAWGKEQARRYALAYWKKSVTLDDYLRNRGLRKEFVEMPEVLIPDDIPTSRIKLIPDN